LFRKGVGTCLGLWAVEVQKGGAKTDIRIVVHPRVFEIILAIDLQHLGCRNAADSSRRRNELYLFW
jgi:hypothetical protein